MESEVNSERISGRQREEVEGEWIAWLADGWHRVAAVEERGKSCMIRAERRFNCSSVPGFGNEV